MAQNSPMTGCEPLSKWFDAFEEDWPGSLDTFSRPFNGLATGIKELDSITTGLRAGSLTNSVYPPKRTRLKRARHHVGG